VNVEFRPAFGATPATAGTFVPGQTSAPAAVPDAVRATALASIAAHAPRRTYDMTNPSPQVRK
jgi:hypothetical protein